LKNLQEYERLKLLSPKDALPKHVPTMHVEDETILRKVHFFDGCEDLEMSDDLRDLLNSKLSKIDNDFKTKMK